MTGSFIDKNKKEICRKKARNRVGFCKNAVNEGKEKTREKKGKREWEREKDEGRKRVSGWFIESLLLVDCRTRNVRGTAG